MNSLQSSLETLLKTALLGTGREGTVPQLEGALHPFGEVKNSPEIALLNAAAATTVSSRAGRLSTQSQTPKIEVCPAETKPYFSSRAVSLLEVCFADYHEVMPQVLKWAAQSGQIAPPTMLPQLLELGRGSRDLQQTIAPILGERGRWLAQLNPDWKNVAAPIDADLETTWQNGEPAARIEALRLERQIDPTTARQWIEAEFKTSGAKDRGQWLEIMRIGLSDEDELFLESALDDKSKDVRAVAISLLETLPNSRLVGRAKAEIEVCLKWKEKPRSLISTLLSRQAGGELNVELPALWNPAWARDGLEENLSPYSRSKSLGQKASWLHAWVRRVPPSYWEEQWKAPPTQIIESTPKDWQILLLTAWWEAARLHRSKDWMLALYDNKTVRDQGNMGWLSPEIADALALVVFKCDGANLKTLHSVANFMQDRTGTWSLEFSRLFFQAAQQGISAWKGEEDRNNPDYRWLRYSLIPFADKIPVELAEAATYGWPQQSTGWEEWEPIVSRFLTRLKLRADLYAEFTKPLP